MSNRPVTHDSPGSTEQAVTTRRLPEDRGIAQPTPTSGRGQPGRKDLPAQSAQPWHQAPARPPDQLTWHRRCLLAWGPPPASPALADPPAQSFCCPRRGGEGRAWRAQLSTRHGGGAGVRALPGQHTRRTQSAQGPGVHLGFAEHRPQPGTGSWDSSQREGRISCPPLCDPSHGTPSGKFSGEERSLCPRPLLPGAFSDPEGPSFPTVP